MALAASLNALNFETGSPFWIAGGAEDLSPNMIPAPGERNSFLAKIVGLFGILIVVLLPVGIVLMIMDPKRRKRIMLILIQVVVLYLIVLGMKNAPANVEDNIILPEFVIEDAERTTPITCETDSQIAICNDAPEWMVILVSTGAVIMLAVIGRFVYMRLIQLTPLQQLAQDAQTALDDLQAGADANDTIRRCYYEMSATLRQEHAIHRNQAMTTREFEQRLEQSGLPRLYVRELTRLFEKVRYGAKSPTEADERQAIECLTAIVQAASAGGSV